MTGTLARAPRRPPPTGSAFIRLLAELNDVPAPASKDAFAQQLSRWFHWTDAISLAATLSGTPEPSTQRRPGVAASAHADEREVGRVRAELVKVVAASAAPADTLAVRSTRSLPTPTPPPEAPVEFAPYRRRYFAAQQAMETQIGPLRRRLRATLTACSPALAQLAGLDAAMEQVIGERERALLSTVPRWLEPRFERLRQAHPAAPAEAPRQPGDWLDVFCRDLRGLLLAELELRLQPVEGLLEALLRSSPDFHE